MPSVWLCCLNPIELCSIDTSAYRYNHHHKTFQYQRVNVNTDKSSGLDLRVPKYLHYISYLTLIYKLEYPCRAAKTYLLSRSIRWEFFVSLNEYIPVSPFYFHILNVSNPSFVFSPDELSENFHELLSVDTSYT